MNETTRIVWTGLARVLIGLALAPAGAANGESERAAEQARVTAESLPWKVVFEYAGHEDWREQWFLDGLKADLRPSDKGLYFAAGPVEQDDASHAVLWTRREFAGDIKVEYDYTRLDTVEQCVNILYLHARGKGEGPYVADISQWSELREIPSMRHYFLNMNALHVSYAAHYMTDGKKSEYVHARRYPVLPDGTFGETGIGERQPVEPFLIAGKAYEITILKLGPSLVFSAKEKGGTARRSFLWDTSGFPDVTAGRIGLRHMWTRASRYANFRVSELGR